jgi:hypothetical protein
MVMYTRSIKDSRILNNNTYAIGPSIGVEIKVFKGLSLNPHTVLPWFEVYTNNKINRLERLPKMNEL